MVVTKMKKAKIKCRECDCWSLTCGIKKKMRGYKTIHTLTKRIKNRTTDNNDNNNNNNSNSNSISSNNNNKQLCKWKVQHDIRHWNWKEKVKMWEILHLSRATIPGMDR